MGLTNTPSDLLPGTLELLILKALVSGAKHGYGIVEHLRLASEDVLSIGESALVTVRLNNVPAEGYTSTEFTCTYNANLFEISKIGRAHV